MFEWFTQGARQVLVLAQAGAFNLGHDYIGTEHLLLGLLGEEEGVAASVLGRSGLTDEAVRAAIVDIVGCGWGRLDDRDAEVLREIGIDLHAVRASIEAAFWPGALDVVGDRRRPRRRRRARCGWTPAAIPFAPRAKKALELALREALCLEDRFIGTEHVLLGLLREGQGVACKLLVDAGIDLDVLRQRTLQARDEAT
ncbi:MAG: Clp protease [Actinobacteria bacterium]|nr:Clp protease [Actinomycetota bacterium]